MSVNRSSLAVKICLAMVAFAANSVLCRLALKGAHIEPVLFSTLRLLSGAAVLLPLLLKKRTQATRRWKLSEAFFLALYALFFSVAYISLDAGTGALLLFGVVQITMVMAGLLRGERLNLTRSCGLIVAIAGIALLLLPGAVAPPLKSALLMGIAGAAWAAYSLSGRSSTDPGMSTAANFLLAVPFAVIALFVSGSDLHYDYHGIVLAVMSGALASAGAYVLWYAIMPEIDAVTASTVQLSVPCLATLAGVLFLGETLTLRMFFSMLAVLAGIWLVVRKKARI